MIHVSHLTKAYGPRIAIKDLNFDVKKGEIVGFLGPNGAGKSTTMKILTGFMPATDGTATVAGFDVFKQPIEVKKRVGYLPENPPVYLEMQVDDYLTFAASLHQMTGSTAKKAVNAVIEKTGLGAVKGRLIGNLSKGFRQRVGLAQALVHSPEVLILDEPTVGLDPAQIIEIRGLIQGLGGNHTVILSSHILPEVTATCERIIIISKGKLAAEDTLEHLSKKVGKGLIYTLNVKKTSKEAIDQIKEIPGVEAVRGSGTTYQIELSSTGKDSRDKIIDIAVEKGMGVLEFSSERISLEEVYLKLTSGD